MPLLRMMLQGARRASLACRALPSLLALAAVDVGVVATVVPPVAPPAIDARAYLSTDS